MVKISCENAQTITMVAMVVVPGKGRCFLEGKCSLKNFVQQKGCLFEVGASLKGCTNSGAYDIWLNGLVLKMWSVSAP